MSTNLYGVHNQWKNRPVDQRFWGLQDMSEALEEVWNRSKETTCPVRKFRAVPVVADDGDDLCINGSRGPVKLTHWSMGQLCNYADAPAGYLHKLPTELAADCINVGLKKYDGEDVQLLLHRNDDQGSDFTIRAITTQYSRLWNKDIISNIKPALDLGWMVPPAMPAVDDPRARPATQADIIPNSEGFFRSVKVGQMIAPAGCYASDRDMFIFMVNPNRVIDLEGDALMRGFFLFNSEVGSGAFKVQMFYLENVCMNHIIYNAKGSATVRIVHKGNNFSQFGSRLSRELRQLTDTNTSTERDMVQKARTYVLGKNREEVIENVYNNKTVGLSKTVIEVSYRLAERYEDDAKSPPNTAWSLTHGITRYSQSLPYTDERAKIDSAAGKLLQLAYTAKS